MYSPKVLLLLAALFGSHSFAAPVVIPGIDFIPSVLSPVAVKREPQNHWTGNGITGKRNALPQNSWAGKGVTGKRSAKRQNSWTGNGTAGKRAAKSQNDWAGNGIAG